MSTSRTSSHGRIMIGALIAGGILAASLAVVTAPKPIIVNLAFVAHFAGLIAGYLVAVLVILMARVPQLEKGFGADRLSRWHARVGRSFIAVMLVHAFAAIAVWVSLRQDGLIGGIANMLTLPWLAAATLGGILLVFVAGLSIRAARRKLSYESWHTAHLLTYIALVLSFGHELAGPNLAGMPAVQVFWSLLYAYTLMLVLRHRVISPLAYYWRHRLTVVSVIPEANGVASIVLRGRHVRELGAESGQFFRWRFLTANTWLSAHPFSLSAPPRDDLLRITVKDLGSGSRLLHSLHPGVRVLAEGPYGAMTARKRTRRSVLLIAGGVGITPMRALFETLDAEIGLVTLLYRASSAADIVFHDELEQLASRRNCEIKWMIGRSSDPANAMTAERLSQIVPDVRERDVYLCASPALSGAVRSALRESGLPQRHLHEEVFAF
ncbi:ferredoxin reductase family protein [soil metagenome]